MFSIRAVIFVLVLCLVLISTSQAGESFASRRRRSREVDEKLKSLDEATKQRIHAMKASGMPNEAIAEKISYVTGGKGTAKRIVDALQSEPAKKQNPKASGKLPPKPMPKSTPMSQPTTTKAKKTTTTTTTKKK